MKRTIPIWMCAGVAALLIFTAYSSWDDQHLRDELRRINQQTTDALKQQKELEEQLHVAQLEERILTDPSSVNIRMSAQDPQLPLLVGKWHAQLGIVLTGQRIPLPPGDRVLELWLIPKTPGSKPIPLVKLRPEADGRFLAVAPILPRTIGDTKALAITEEPAAGSLQPTTTSRWVGSVR